jgi:hypothetical protein
MNVDLRNFLFQRIEKLIKKICQINFCCYLTISYAWLYFGHIDILYIRAYIKKKKGRGGHDRIVVGFTTCAISAYHHFISDLQHVGGFIWVLRFPPTIKLMPQYNWNIVESGTISLTLTYIRKLRLRIYYVQIWVTKNKENSSF